MFRASPPASPSDLRASLVGALLTYLAAVVNLVLATEMVFSVAGRILAHGHPEREPALACDFARSAAGTLSAGLVSSCVLALTAWVSARCHGSLIVEQLRVGSSRAAPLGLAATIGGTLGLSAATGSVADLLHVGQSTAMDALADSLGRASRPQVALAIVTVAVLPAIAEELLFRGFLQSKFVAILGSWPGIVVTAVAFGLIHFDLVQGVLAGTIGIFLGWTAERFRGIRATIVAHAINNLVFVVTSMSQSVAGPSKTTVAAVAAVGTGIWLASMWVLRSPAALTTRMQDASPNR